MDYLSICKQRKPHPAASSASSAFTDVFPACFRVRTISWTVWRGHNKMHWMFFHMSCFQLYIKNIYRHLFYEKIFQKAHVHVLPSKLCQISWCVLSSARVRRNKIKLKKEQFLKYFSLTFPLWNIFMIQESRINLFSYAREKPMYASTPEQSKENELNLKDSLTIDQGLHISMWWAEQGAISSYNLHWLTNSIPTRSTFFLICSLLAWN